MNNEIAQDFDLGRIYYHFWRIRWVNICLTIVVIVVMFFVSNQLPDVYRSEVLLVPAESSDVAGLASVVGRFGNLASLAGVNLEKSQYDKADVAVEILKSKKFLIDFINRHNMLVPLIAGVGWDSENNTLKIDQRLYDSTNGKWVGIYKEAKSGQPTAMQAYDAMRSKISIAKAKDSGMITLGIDFVSPVMAKEWLELLVTDINERIKENDIQEASKSIDYMRKQLDSTPLAEMKQVFYQLIEKQVQIVMLANVRDEYVFKVVDPAYIPEEKVGPKRFMMMVFALFCLQMIVFVVVLARCMFGNESKNHQDV